MPLFSEWPSFMGFPRVACVHNRMIPLPGLHRFARFYYSLFASLTSVHWYAMVLETTFHLQSASFCLSFILWNNNWILFSGRGPQPTEGCQAGKLPGGGRIPTRNLHVQTLRPYPPDCGLHICWKVRAARLTAVKPWARIAHISGLPNRYHLLNCSLIYARFGCPVFWTKRDIDSLRVIQCWTTMRNGIHFVASIIPCPDVSRSLNIKRKFASKLWLTLDRTTEHSKLD